MTPAELQRLAGRHIAEAESLRVDAGRLRAQARALQGLLDPLPAMSERVWVGPAATRFQEDCWDRARLLNGQAVRLEGIALEWEQRARRLVTEAGRLRREGGATTAAPAVGLPGGLS